MARQIAQAIFGDPDKIQIKVIGYDKRVSSVVDGSVEGWRWISSGTPVGPAASPSFAALTS